MSMVSPHLVLPVSVRDHIAGPATAPATLLEYGDYECPFCGAAHPIVQQVRKQLDKLISVVQVDDFSEQDYVERDLMLIKVRSTPQQRMEIVL